MDTGVEDVAGADILVHVSSASTISLGKNASFLIPSSMMSCASTMNLFFKAASVDGWFLQESSYVIEIDCNDLPF